MIGLDEKKKEKCSWFFVGFNLFRIAKVLVINVPKTTVNMKDYDGDRYLTIINNEENESFLLNNRNMRKRLKILSREKGMLYIILFMAICKRRLKMNLLIMIIKSF